MIENQQSIIHDWVIVGGGIHGTHLAIRLLEAYGDKKLSLRIIDPHKNLLSNWQKQTLKSNF